MSIKGMNVSERNILSRIDVRLIGLIFTLNIIGLINLFSATHGPHSRDVETLFVQQIVWLIAGWTIFFVMTFLLCIVEESCCFFVIMLLLRMSGFVLVAE